MISEHAKVQPSGLKRTVKCVGSLLPISEVPPDNTDSAEGDAAHHAAKLLATGEHLWPVGVFAPQGTAITEEMIKTIGPYLEQIKGYGHIEQRVHIPRIHPTLCWGTVDAWHIVDPSGVIMVDDLKYGYKWVEPETEQMIAYGCGIADQLNVVDTCPVRLTITQPIPFHPDGPIRSWLTTAGELRRRCEAMAPLVEKALQPNAELVTGEWCYRCPHQYNCNANKEAEHNAIDVSHSIGDMLNVSTDWLGKDLKTIQRAQQLLKEKAISIEEVLAHRLKQGDYSKYFERAITHGHRAWNDKTQIKLLGELANTKLTDDTPVTPAEAERRGISKQLVNSLTHKPEYVKLKPIDNRLANKVFKND